MSEAAAAAAADVMKDLLCSREGIAACNLLLLKMFRLLLILDQRF
jgi:hypothetical protein